MDLFTYGSLMYPTIMARVAGEEFSCLQAQLTGYFRSQVVGEVYPGILPQETSSVPGVLYLAVSPQAIARLDTFEGNYYQRQLVEVIGPEGSPRSAETYVFKPAFYHLLTMVPWSYEEFLTRGKNQFEADYAGFDRI